MRDIVSDAAADLNRVVKINEENKKVVQISSEVNQVALNAMLTAKRSGEKSRGFGVVSSELRVFSGKLEHFMIDLEAPIFELLKGVSQLLRQAQVQHHFVKAMNGSDSAKRLLTPVLARKEAEMAIGGERVKRDWCRLAMLLKRALQLCETGGALSRSAKIEAVYGGDMTASLKQVSNQIERTVESILSILKALRTEMC
ncbi:MAG: hypothetical protein Q8O38_02595 [Sulfurimicrobium sp.]|nr:hypothetical protein [Sulfurimicrobium sp.]